MCPTTTSASTTSSAWTPCGSTRPRLRPGMAAIEALLTNCRLPDGSLGHIGRAGARRAALGPGVPASTCPSLDLAGDLVLPGLVDGHLHLDKTLLGLPWMG